MALCWEQHTLWGNYANGASTLAVGTAMINSAAPMHACHLPCCICLSLMVVRGHVDNAAPVHACPGLCLPGCVCVIELLACGHGAQCYKLTWLVLGGDPVARSHRVEQFTAL